MTGFGVGVPLASVLEGLAMRWWDAIEVGDEEDRVWRSVDFPALISARVALNDFGKGQWA